MRHPLKDIDDRRIPSLLALVVAIVAVVLNFAFWAGLLILAAYLVKWVMS